MKPPYFPEPPKGKEASPYREPEPVASHKHAAAVVVSRPEPLDDDPPPAKRPTKPASWNLTPLEARALLAIDRGTHTKPSRAKLLLLPITLAVWRYGDAFGALRWVLYPLATVSLAFVLLEIRRIWRRTAP